MYELHYADLPPDVLEALLDLEHDMDNEFWE
jgi:hypothetical protein